MTDQEYSEIEYDNEDDEDEMFMEVPINEVIQEHSNICEIAECYETEGFLHIGNGHHYLNEIERMGLAGLLGVITAAVTMGYDTRTGILKQMRIAAPKLRRSFNSDLLDLVTGDNPHRHLLTLTRTDTYQLMSYAVKFQGTT